MTDFFLLDPTLSAGAKGVFAYIKSFPKDKKFYQQDLIGHFKNGRDSLRHFMKELIEGGYIKRTSQRNENDSFNRYVYTVNTAGETEC